jgi:uncharacterized phage protein (TIGR02218 family)
VIDGVTYRATEGLTATATHTTKDLSVDTMDVTVFLEVSTETEVATGLWDGCVVTVFEANWDTLPTALDTKVNILRAGDIGKITRQQHTLRAEIRSLLQRLTNRIGRQYIPTCPWRHARWNGTTYVSSVECGLDMTARIGTGTVTALGDDPTTQFYDTALTSDPDYYNEGLLTFTSGNNVQVTREVRIWTVTHLFEMRRPFPFAVQVGDAYKAVIGDDKTEARCITLGQILNFGGFAHIPGAYAVYANPTGL